MQDKRCETCYHFVHPDKEYDWCHMCVMETDNYRPIKTECCETCRLKLRIEKLDYSKGGCTHTWPEGYICLAFRDEGIACWMVGEPAERGMCECYTPKEGQSDDYDPCYECGGYGDDYRFDEDGELVLNCPDCPFNQKEDA